MRVFVEGLQYDAPMHYTNKTPRKIFLYNLSLIYTTTACL